MLYIPATGFNIVSTPVYAIQPLELFPKLENSRFDFISSERTSTYLLPWERTYFKKFGNL